MALAILAGVFQHVGNGEPAVAVADNLFERHAGDVFHGDVFAPLLLADVVNADDIVVAQAAGGARFLAEAAHGLHVAREVLGQDLEGHDLIQFVVVRAVNDAHCAASDFLEQLIAPLGRFAQVLQDGLALLHERLECGGLGELVQLLGDVLIFGVDGIDALEGLARAADVAMGLHLLGQAVEEGLDIRIHGHVLEFLEGDVMKALVEEAFGQVASGNLLQRGVEAGLLEAGDRAIPFLEPHADASHFEPKVEIILLAEKVVVDLHEEALGLLVIGIEIQHDFQHAARGGGVALALENASLAKEGIEIIDVCLENAVEDREDAGVFRANRFRIWPRWPRLPLRIASC